MKNKFQKYIFIKMPNDLGFVRPAGNHLSPRGIKRRESGDVVIEDSEVAGKSRKIQRMRKRRAEVPKRAAEPKMAADPVKR